MYDRFEPKAITQGLPPAGEKGRREWIDGLLNAGMNFVARDEREIVGHASVLMDPERNSGEYLIFVDHRIRNRGLGAGLTRAAIDRAAEMGVREIWLTVEALNFRAIKLYRKMGFCFCDSGERERTMVLNL
jgi:ribosomal protein S18 acetylase RimI-like enzyme